MKVKVLASKMKMMIMGARATNASLNLQDLLPPSLGLLLRLP
jgi:hypothetical protein